MGSRDGLKSLEIAFAHGQFLGEDEEGIQGGSLSLKHSQQPGPTGQLAVP